MRRRTFALNAASLAGAVALAGTAAPRPARAQGGVPVEGHDYQVLAKPLAVAANGKIEVIEFFWYACPHCFAFEPVIEPWIAKLPADIQFRRVPVGFDALKEIHQRVYYTWEALGLVDAMHQKTFVRFHVQRKPIDTEADMYNFAAEAGLDVAKVKAAWNSFSVASKCQQARRLEDDYAIERMPEMGIQGRFTVFAQADSSHAATLAITDRLIDRVRHGG